MAGRIAYTGGIVTNGLILNLDAAKRDSYPGSGTVWRDIAGSTVTGSLINGPTFNSNNGGSILFNGTNNYTDTNIDMVGYTDFTISMFAKSLDTWPASGTTFRALCGNLGGGSYVRMNITTTAASVFFWANGPGTFSSAEVFNTSSNINDWYYYTLTRSTTFQRIYLNGVLKSEVTFSNTASLSNYYRSVGQYGTSYFWNGNIADYKIYNRALSATEITQNYNALKGRYGL